MKNYVVVPALCLLACCSAPRPIPAPPPPVAPRPVAPPLLPAPPAAARWEDWPYTAGTWLYGPVAGGSAASFVGIDRSPRFAVQCVSASRTIQFLRLGTSATTATVAFTTSAGTAAYPTQQTAQGMVATTRGSDPFLDKIAFSRGRFVVAVSGSERLVLPSWAEVARVVEDCR